MLETEAQIRVRIAPSPTGDPHVGTAYVALFNYVFAKKNSGKFILRIEDTDQTRSRQSSESLILESLSWLGLQWDEGPDIGGPFGPYRQSERLSIYREKTAQLIETGHAYYCFCSANRLEAIRSQQKVEGKTTRYDRHCFGLAQEEIQQKLDAGFEHVIRLRTPEEGTTALFDELRGKVEINNEQLDDQILIKSDGFPTYHLANVVDDHLMKITHVIRAEEWISSTPKHVLLYRAFGWNAPKWIHLPLLRNSDKSKISKRKNPISISYYRRAGILSKALVNYLALMGWSFGNDREIFSLNEMIEIFDFKGFSLGGPVFDQVKLTWLNQIYMHQMTEDEFVDFIRNEIFSEEYLRKLKPLVLERMSRFEQFVDKNSFFFSGALDYSGVEVMPKTRGKEEVAPMLKELLMRLDDLYSWDQEHINNLLKGYQDEIAWKPKDFYMTLRLIVSGRKDSPPLNETIELLGREIVRFRIRDFLESLKLGK